MTPAEQGWTDALRSECQDQCAPDPPCFALRTDGEPAGFLPCADCLRACGFEVPEPLDPNAVVAELFPTPTKEQ